MKRVQILGIDVIRFFAATSVVVWHFMGKPFLTPERATLHPLMPDAGPSIPFGVEQIWFGWIGVQIFFVVSGVVIAFSAERATPRSFFIGRFVRLWPVMAISASICTLLSMIFWKTSITTAALRLFSSLTFFPLGPWFSGQVWTLPIEIVFYSLVWLLILGKRIDWIERLAWGICLASFSYWIARSSGLIPAIMHLRLFLLFHGC